MSVEQKLAKSLARFQERISNGSFYEAQQTIRSITNRYVHANQFSAAISLLYQSTMILLESKQYDEAADLYIYMLEVMGNEKRDKDGGSGSIDKSDMDKISSIISMYPEGNENLLTLSKDTGKWVTAQTGSVAGDGRLNTLLGLKLVKSASDGAINAGLRLLMLSSDVKALETITSIEYGTFQHENKVDSFVMYLSRVVLPYLLIKNVRFAEIVCRKLIERFVEEHEQFKYENVGGLTIFEVQEGAELENFFKTINFIQLLVELVKRGRKEDGNTFTLLLKRYQAALKVHEGLFERVNEIAVMYYGISFIKKQSNLLQDMMGSFLGGK
jgi:golgi to ER traffic protein 4